MVYDIVEGTTNTLQFQLLENGSPVNLTNIMVTLLLEDRTGTAVANPGTVTINDAPNGRVQFAPNNIFIATTGPLLARWQLINSIGGGTTYVPSSVRDVWNIVGL